MKRRSSVASKSPWSWSQIADRSCHRWNDHITRVRAGGGGGLDPSRSLADALSILNLPPNTILIVLSQPGSHLRSLEEAGAKVVTIPGLMTTNLNCSPARFNIVPSDEYKLSPDIKPLIEDTEYIVKFLAALVERSGGNALYATFLCRETLRIGDSQIDSCNKDPKATSL